MSEMPITINYGHLLVNRNRIINGTEYEFLYERHESWTDSTLKYLPSDKNVGSVSIKVNKCLGEYPGGARRWTRVHDLFWTYEVKS